MSRLSTTLRIANLSPDLGPIDFCWRLSGSATFTGPVLGPAPDAGSAGDAGHDATAGDATIDGGNDAAAPDASDAEAHVLSFGHLSGDVDLPAAGTLDLALVVAGDPSCVDAKIVARVTLDAGKRATVVVMGLASTDAADDALSITAFTDDPKPDAQSARVRVVHAALGWPGGAPPLALQAGNEMIAARVEPGHATTPSVNPPVDPLGYASVMPVPGLATVRIDSLGDAGASAWSTSAFDLGMQLGTVHTAFVVHMASAPGVLWCSEAKTSSPLAPCALLEAH